jgi:anaerobic magnesium-protoporphyrin IX monomethyl ester cyclase
MKELFLFVRPPRPLWPFNGPGSAFWPPLAFVSLAAALRNRLPDLRVAVLDAPALEMGWKSLTAEMERLAPDYVGIGEEAVSCREGLRVAGLAKAAGARVVAGGCFFGNVAPETLSTGLVDVVVHGEGENTLVELIEALRSELVGDLRRVAGISFRDGEEIIRTPARPLIPDLDSLPLPAYDLLPVSRYGRKSLNHPALGAIELGRGCCFGCDFCVLWRQMGRAQSGKLFPHVRTKSAERLREEIRILMDRFGRRYLGWVDPCFNADPDAPRTLAELLLKENRRIGQSAWVRADCLVRDSESGSLDTSIKAGLNEVYIGIERLEARDLQMLKKGNLKGEIQEALRILEEDHPEVFTVGSFIYGLPGDTAKDVRHLFRRASELPLDMLLFIPRTPLPGTPYWRKEYWDPTGDFARGLDFLPTMNGDPDRDLLTKSLYRSMYLDWPWTRLAAAFRELFVSPPRHRSIQRRYWLRVTRFVTRELWKRWWHFHSCDGMYTPAWYEH